MTKRYGIVQKSADIEKEKDRVFWMGPWCLLGRHDSSPLNCTIPWASFRHGRLDIAVASISPDTLFLSALGRAKHTIPIFSFQKQAKCRRSNP